MRCCIMHAPLVATPKPLLVNVAPIDQCRWTPTFGLLSG